MKSFSEFSQEIVISRSRRFTYSPYLHQKEKLAESFRSFKLAIIEHPHATPGGYLDLFFFFFYHNHKRRILRWRESNIFEAKQVLKVKGAGGGGGEGGRVSITSSSWSDGPRPGRRMPSQGRATSLQRWV